MKLFALTIAALVLGAMFAPRQTFVLVLCWGVLLVLYHHFFAI
jgi:hypothetical protein